MLLTQARIDTRMPLNRLWLVRGHSITSLSNTGCNGTLEIVVLYMEINVAEMRSSAATNHSAAIGRRVHMPPLAG